MAEIAPVKISDKLTDSITRLYKVGGLGLVFIFLGFLSMLLSFMDDNGRFSLPLFIIGSILLSISFLIFIVVQYRVPVKAQKTLAKHKDTIDKIQDISIALTKLTYNIQSYSFKHIEEIEETVNNLSPLIKPFIGEKGRIVVSKIENISQKIVEYADSTEKIILDIKEALEKGDLSKFEEYKLKLDELNTNIQNALKK